MELNNECAPNFLLFEGSLQFKKPLALILIGQK